MKIIFYYAKNIQYLCLARTFLSFCHPLRWLQLKRAKVTHRANPKPQNHGRDISNTAMDNSCLIEGWKFKILVFITWLFYNFWCCAINKIHPSLVHDLNKLSIPVFYICVWILRRCALTVCCKWLSPLTWNSVFRNSF